MKVKSGHLVKDFWSYRLQSVKMMMMKMAMVMVMTMMVTMTKMTTTMKMTTRTLIMMVKAMAKCFNFTSTPCYFWGRLSYFLCLWFSSLCLFLNVFPTDPLCVIFLIFFFLNVSFINLKYFSGGNI